MKRAVLQKLILVLFFVIIYLGLSNVPHIREYNYLANYAVWFLWWPLLMVIGLLSIRFWCMVCPLRLITDIYSKFSFGLRIPKIMEKYKTLSMVLIFLVLHYTVVSLNINNLPITTAIYLLGLLQYSALMALIFQKNSFCLSFCPLGGMMNIFSRVGLVRLGAMYENRCQSCMNKTCAGNCPVNLSTLDLPSSSCVFCGDCIDGCVKNNIRFYMVNPLKFKVTQSDRGEVLSIIILLGIAIAEFRERLEVMAVPGGNWNLIPGKIIEFIPNKLNQIFGSHYFLKLFIPAWEYVIVPLVIVLVATVFLKAIFFKLSFKYHINNLTQSIVPFIYSIYLAVLINYPLTLLSGPALVRKALLIGLLLFGIIASLYILYRNLVYYPHVQKVEQTMTPNF